MKIKSFIAGTLLGIIVPCITFCIFYRANYSHITILQYINIITLNSMLSKVLSLAVVPNLLVFYIWIWLKKDRWARGVLFGTMLMALFTMIVYFF